VDQGLGEVREVGRGLEHVGGADGRGTRRESDEQEVKGKAGGIDFVGGGSEEQEVAMGETPVGEAVDLSGLVLDVYESRTGWWHPERGEVEPPGDWDFVPTGNAFVTRTVKAAGVFWLAWAPRSRSRPHRRLLGLWAPETTIRAAQQAAADTEAARAARRVAGARRRERQEARYQDELTAAIVTYLDFAPEHQALAETIATAAAQRATVVGSGRVGRTRLLSMEERGALAARAELRHAYTDYEQQLAAQPVAGDDDELYREIKAYAHDEVDRFIEEHRLAEDG
jgi:hypothetical protein